MTPAAPTAASTVSRGTLTWLTVSEAREGRQTQRLEALNRDGEASRFVGTFLGHVVVYRRLLFGFRSRGRRRFRRALDYGNLLAARRRRRGWRRRRGRRILLALRSGRDVTSVRDVASQDGGDETSSRWLGRRGWGRRAGFVAVRREGPPE